MPVQHTICEGQSAKLGSRKQNGPQREGPPLAAEAGADATIMSAAQSTNRAANLRASLFSMMFSFVVGSVSR
jgi:hypothetical protein